MARISDRLPPREEFLIQGAEILTMDPALGDFAGGDIHVRNGEIIAVGHGLSAPNAAVIDARKKIALPGFVDTHWHLWNGLFRGLVGFYDPKLTYFPMKVRLGPHYTPEDMYRAVQLSLAEALASGITCVHNWAHNIVVPEHADANILAHLETGLRGRFSYGWAEGQPDQDTMDLEDLSRVQREWFSDSGLLTLGVALRGAEGPRPEDRRDAYLREFEVARRLGVPITTHVAQHRAAARHSKAIAALGRDGLLGPDVQLVHAIHATPEDRQMMAEAGTHLSLSPFTELQVGMGFPQTTEMLDAGILVSLSVDTLAVTNSDMFATMRAIIDVEHARHENQNLTMRRVLEMATIDGARDLGLDHLIGSLTPGKRADFILVGIDQINMSTLESADWVRLLVHHAQTSNIDLVSVDGRILKRDGKPVMLDEKRIIHDALLSTKAIMERAGLHAPQRRS
ncbi:amidohydrolase family protein [Pseudorhodoplanes sp.]|uniref:amidohydrolase family protein n=1 Tax=Pseudorhodoplanes sp. TaxID=1934341 RepID=UPI003D09C58B